ncbi:ribosome small subunit-dependent GTPase A [Heliobacterium gestii]|uniref:Small ribosomal subunit biogenesis GTPase RsgA n=1 Tax=Heliomicrobium gestii TaxID=2699 RepID=A0A845LF87_HELGE|nr:ribosome small subunit-dependent GTPase A [Heliomicrobium gestii]MBM7867015.1 ribosome biogenesis GTPase [Heliomicrobium gestii]MZP43570.1 ribosome small subunit-dependent GTPase A [Heliomicrobium gestii]
MNQRETEGTIIKGYSGFYYVLADGRLYTCSLRGKHRLKGDDRVFLPGDRVRLCVIEGEKGVIERTLPRRNELLRPPVANVDQVLLVFALASPDPDFVLVDRLLLLAAHAGIRPVLVWNKADIAPPERVAQVQALYKALSIDQFVLSARQGDHLEGLKDLLEDRISVVAGPSGAGKSTLLNALAPGLSLKTGDVSVKIGRGRHTTRHVELIQLASDALVADTPGFSTLYLPDLPAQDLAEFFPEMATHLGHCRFADCLHRTEPDCAVIEALEAGRIHRQRYNHYLMFLNELIERERQAPKGRKS